MAKLTDKQKRFVDEYLLDLNATQAAIRAGYSVKNSFKIGSELLQKTTVQNQIQKRMCDREKRTEITQDKVLQEIAHIAFDDISNYLDFHGETTQIGEDFDGNPIFGFKTIVDLKDSRTIDTRSISEISIGRDGQFKFKLYSKSDALVQLGKHLGMFNDKNETKNTNILADIIEKAWSEKNVDG